MYSTLITLMLAVGFVALAYDWARALGCFIYDCRRGCNDPE